MSSTSARPCQKVWEGMMRRCYCERHRAYHRYGGRGIDVCNQWHDRNRFFAWLLSNGWQKGLQLDRIDNDKGYSPENCRVVDPTVNANNRSNNHVIFIKGEYLTISQAAVKYDMLKTTIRYRVSKLGLTGDDIIGPMMRTRVRTTDPRGRRLNAN